MTFKQIFHILKKQRQKQQKENFSPSHHSQTLGKDLSELSISLPSTHASTHSSLVSTFILPSRQLKLSSPKIHISLNPIYLTGRVENLPINLSFMSG